MAEQSYPFDNADTNETQYSRLFRLLKATGVWGSPGGTELKAFGDSSGMQVKLPAGFAFVRGHLYYNDATKTVSVPAAFAGASVATLVLRLDPTANSITPLVLAGTSGSSTPPTLTQTDAGVYDLPVSDIAVGAGASTITAGNVTDRRLYAGDEVGLWTTATRPTGQRQGKVGWNTTTSKLEVWDGSAWADVAPSAVNPANLSSAVPINKGGTGQTTKSAALAALGIHVNATDPGGVDGDLWFW